MKMLKVLVCRVGEQPKVEDVESAYDHTRLLLGDPKATIQIAPLRDGGDGSERCGMELYCDEEAKAKGLPFNRGVPARALEVPPGFSVDDIIVTEPGLAPPGKRGYYNIEGPFVLAKYDYQKDHNVDLDDDDIAKWTFNLALV